MSKLNYKQILTIQENTTKKLISYINEFVKKDKMLDSIEFYYPDFDEQKTKTAFNIWISTDYRTNYGKSFIEHMLEDRSSHLTNMEKEILIERNKSFVSLFEIEQIKDNNISLLDLLTGKHHIIWDPNISGMLRPSDLIFGRIGKIIDYKGFIGNISFLPPSVKSLFMGEVFIDYNRIRFRFPKLSINEYLKIYSINVYRIYTECIYEVIDVDQDLTNTLYDELDEFENYLLNYMSRIHTKKHITNLINLFEYYLMDKELSLYDMDQIDIKHLFKKAIADGYILTQRELSSYISTFKRYIGFLKTKDTIYNGAYEAMLEISKNRFLYLDSHRLKKTPFNINRVIADNLLHKMNDYAFDFIMDYEKFLLYIMSNPLGVTTKRRHIKRNHLIELNDIMDYSENILKKSPNQRDFPMLDFFYKFSLDKRLLMLKNDCLTVTKISSNFLRLNDEEKYSIFLQYIMGKGFIPDNKECFEPNKLCIAKRKLIKTLISLTAKTWHKVSELPIDALSSMYLQAIHKYLEMMGILEYRLYPSLSVSITPFGKSALGVIYKSNKNNRYIGKIIHLQR